jgi:hypothetical protein
MKRFLLLPAILLPPLMLLSVLSVILGQALNWLPGDFGTIETCRLPCWNGIRAGQTPVKEADATLHTLGFELQSQDDNERLASTFSYAAAGANAICQVGIGRTPGVIPRVSELTLRFCGSTALGHIIDMLGEPETILPIVSMVNYHQGEIIVILRSRMCETAPSPHTPLLFISLTPPVVTSPQNSILAAEQAGEKDSESTNLPWRGFIPVWRYGQLFPSRAVC